MADSATGTASRVRYSWLDFWRGVGVFIVVVGHATTTAHFGMGDAPGIHYILRQMLAAVGTRIMEFFFFASGFLICGIFLRLERFRRPWLAYLINRVKRIIPSFATYLLAITLLHALGAEFVPVLCNVPGGMWWVSSFTTNWLVISQQSWGIGTLVVHFWSLAVEEQLCLIAPFILLALRRYPKFAGRCVLAGTILIPLAGILRGSVSGVDRFIFVNTFMQLDAFALGMWLAMLPTPPAFLRLSIKMWLVLCVPLILSVILFFCNSSSMTMHVASIVSAKMCGVLWFVLVCRAIASGERHTTNPLRRFFELLGRRIYGVYVWHKLVLVAALWALARFSVTPSLVEGSLALFSAFAAASLLLSLGLSQVGWTLVRPLLYPAKKGEGQGA